MKSIVEWKDGDAWKQVRVELRSSRRNNTFFTLGKEAYIVTDLKIGSDILVKSGTQWIKAGRVARGVIFLGEGQTYSEYMEGQALKTPVWTKPLF